MLIDGSFYGLVDRGEYIWRIVSGEGYVCFQRIVTWHLELVDECPGYGVVFFLCCG
jgi:hypothetical protein